MPSEKQKRARNKWDAENMTVLGCKFRRDKAERFKLLCKRNGTSPNAVFLAAMERFIEEHKDSC